MRKLASVQKIDALTPIPGADLIEVAHVLGWTVVTQKNQYQQHNLCVYCEVDSVLPALPEYEFLKRYKYRVKTIKIRGQLSQGVILPMSSLPPGEYGIGQDVTELLGITKYVTPDRSGHTAPQAAGSWPWYVRKTDEPRIQSYPKALEELSGRNCYATLKMDGTSATYYKLGSKIGVCSRTREVREYDDQGNDNVYWRMFRKYRIDEILSRYNTLAIQGEIVGYWNRGQRSPIQNNQMTAPDTDLYVFDVYDIEERVYYSLSRLQAFCAKYNLKPVPVLWSHLPLNNDLDELLAIASETRYSNGVYAEGMVIRTADGSKSDILPGPRASFKVINNNYLLKNS